MNVANVEWKKMGVVAAVFGLCFYLPIDSEAFRAAVMESLALVKWYAREHVLLCLIPAFFIAGAVSVFIKKDTIIKYFGAGANKVVAYAVASVSGAVLSVCSCTVLPLFSSIYRMGAGLGPATAFLYSGPAINVLAVAMTAQVLGSELGIARAVGAVVFSVVIGLLMQFFFRHAEVQRASETMDLSGDADVDHPLWQRAVFFGLLVAVLVFANWSAPAAGQGFGALLFRVKWWLAGLAAAGLGLALIRWYKLAWWKPVAAAVPVVLVMALRPDLPVAAFAVGSLGLVLITATDDGESGDWFAASWRFARQILPLLLAGVIVAGLLMGGPDGGGLIPEAWVSGLVGGNSLMANFAASVLGAFMYFATLTEVPILYGLMQNGMGSGPALALLLAGPALSLPNMLVIRSVLGWRRTFVFVGLVVVMAAVSGKIFGMFWG